MEDKKKVEIPENLLKVVDDDRLNEVIKQVEDAENDFGIERGVTKEVLNMMKGKKVCDLSHTIIALAQATPLSVLHSLCGTLDFMVRTEVIKMLQSLKAEGIETPSEEDE